MFDEGRALGFKAWDLVGYWGWVEDLDFRTEGSGFRILGFRILGFRV